MKATATQQRIRHLKREMNRVPPRTTKWAMLRDRIERLAEQQRVEGGAA